MNKSVLDKKALKALNNLDNLLGIPSDTCINYRERILLYSECITTFSCIHTLFHPNMEHIAISIFMIGILIAMKMKIRKEENLNIDLFSTPHNFCTAYEYTYLKNLDENDIEKALELLIEENLIDKDFSKEKIISLLDRYATKTSYNNLLYMHLSLKNKKIKSGTIKNLPMVDAKYIQQRKLKIKQEFIKELQK